MSHITKSSMAMKMMMMMMIIANQTPVAGETSISSSELVNSGALRKRGSIICGGVQVAVIAVRQY